MSVYNPPLPTPVSIANGGTNNGSLAVTAGGILYSDGTKLQNIGAGSAGQILQSNAGSAPTWAANSNAITNTYYSGYFSGCSWSNSSTSFSAMSVNTGSPTLTQRKANILSVTGAASSLPGINFTPASSSAVYYVTAVIGVINTGAVGTAFLMTDGTTEVIQSPSETVSAGYTTITLSGIYAPATSSTVNLTLQCKVVSSTAYISASDGGIVLEWSIFRIF